MAEKNEQDGPAPFDDLFNARLKAIFEATLKEHAPLLIEAAARRASEMVQVQAAERQGIQGAATASAPAVPDPTKSVADAIRWGIAALPKALAESLDSYDKLVSIRLKQTNPFVYMTELKKSNPEMTSFIAQQFAPEPLQNIMPALLAKNSLDTANAVVRTMMRQGLVPRGGQLAIDPFGEPFEEPELPSEDYARETPKSEPQSAEMRARKERATGELYRATRGGFARARLPSIVLREALG